jgi:hypothetical protein
MNAHRDFPARGTVGQGHNWWAKAHPTVFTLIFEI